MPSPAPPDDVPAVDRSDDAPDAAPIPAADAPTPAAASQEEIERVFGQQRRAVKREMPPPLDERKDRLRRLRRAVMERRLAIQEALHADFRKPPEEADASEIKALTGQIDHTLSGLTSWMKPRSVGTPAMLTGTSSEVRFEPKGVVLILAPWNYPLTLTLGPLVSALAAGNRAVVKPSEFTPHAAGVMRELVAEAFDEAHVALFEGNEAVAEALLEQPFDHVYFTGSPAIGKKVMTAAAEHLASVTLELGGKSPAVVDETADVEDAARKIAWGKFTNAGQTCIAPDYVLVHEGQKARLVYALRRRLRQFYGATPEERQATPDYARLVSDKHFDHVTGLLDDAVERGAHVSEGGEAERSERYVPPTILTDVPDGARVMEEEIFGPVLPVVSFSTLAGAVDRINGKPNPLALYVFSEREANAEYVIERTTAGGTCVNDALLHYLNPELPFGGVGESGQGRAHGERGFRELSNERAVLHRRFGSGAMEWLYPPYGDTVRRLLDTALRWL
jgi:aldehyde dehydrogenase (NAD+)